MWKLVLYVFKSTIGTKKHWRFAHTHSILVDGSGGVGVDGGAIVSFRQGPQALLYLTWLQHSFEHKLIINTEANGEQLSLCPKLSAAAN
jgi:hypothetical protein